MKSHSDSFNFRTIVIKTKLFKNNGLQIVYSKSILPFKNKIQVLLQLQVLGEMFL